MNLSGQSVIVKILFLLCIYIAHGRPFVGLPDYAFALLTAYLLLFGIVRKRVKLTFVLMGLFFLILNHWVPQLEISEQESFLLDTKAAPATPNQFLVDTSKYPSFLTADGYLQGYKDRRVVRNIDIDKGVLSLRSGFINLPKYNFYLPLNSLQRENIPYGVSYKIVPEMVGMTLALEGLLFFIRDGQIKIHDKAIKTLVVQKEHVGSRIQGFGGQWEDKGYNNLKIKLEKTPLYKFYDSTRILCLFLGLVALFFGLFFLTPTPDFARQSLLFGFSTVSFWVHFPNIFRWGILAKGGGDGIIHGGFPYVMLEKWAIGDWGGALMSPERVFYFMPGMRYVRFLEMLLFGDAYIFQVCLIIFAPIIFYRFFCAFLTQQTALILSFLAFAHLFNGIGLSYKLYLNSMINLYGEGISYALLFISLTLLAKTIYKTGWGFLAFFLSAISISIRPNLAVFMGVIAVFHLLTKTFTPLGWRSRFIMLLGLVPVLLIPLHNILGGEFVLLTKASQIPENLPLSPSLYYQAITYILGLNDSFQEMGRFLIHVRGFYPQYILAWAGLFWLALKGNTTGVRVIALAAFAGLSLHFFYLPNIRYIHPYLTIAIILSLSQIPRLSVKGDSLHLLGND